METIGTQIIWSFYKESAKAEPVKNDVIRLGEGHRVGSFLELATKIAELQFRNRDQVLLFRGQNGDYRNARNQTTLKPTLFRPRDRSLPSPDLLINRFKQLEQAEKELVRFYLGEGLLGKSRIQRYRILRWSILQHYEVVPTPLLDVTHSLRIAASFASLGATGDAFLFVLGVPNLSGAITASTEAGIQMIRLSSVCPPAALRPHLQEGYLLGEYPELFGFDQKALYDHAEVDFGRRLMAKFRFDPKLFWKRGAFPKVPKEALYPSAKNDPLYDVALKVKKAIETIPV